jgi:hypothetical protein
MLCTSLSLLTSTLIEQNYIILYHIIYETVFSNVQIISICRNMKLEKLKYLIVHFNVIANKNMI